MKKFLQLRMDEKLINADALEKAIVHSGGVARDFVRILRTACTKALTQRQDMISLDIVNDVILDVGNEYSRGMEKRHFVVLKTIQKQEPVEDKETLMELFHSRVVLEYVNGEKWTGIHPIVLPLLKEMRI